MSVTPHDLIGLARTLHAGPDETHWRCSISRAYYAAYHSAHKWHAALPVPGSATGPAGGAHQVLINQLSHPDITLDKDKKTQSRTLSAKLSKLRDTRNWADYDLANSIAAELAAKALADAADILSKTP